MFTKNNEPTKSKVRHWDRNTPCEWFDLTDYSNNCYNWAIIQVKLFRLNIWWHIVCFIWLETIWYGLYGFCKKYALIKKKIRNWTSAHFYNHLGVFLWEIVWDLRRQRYSISHFTLTLMCPSTIRLSIKTQAFQYTVEINGENPICLWHPSICISFSLPSQ